MSASATMSEQNNENEVPRFLKTDPDKVIEVGGYSGYTDTHPKPIVASYKEFFESLSQPDELLHTKEGPCFLIGPCHGTRRAANIPHTYLAVLDADSSIDQAGAITEGAPPPAQVHEALKKWGLSHCIYTTHSHGKKGNRYRVVFPVVCQDGIELRAFLLYLANCLQEHGNIPLALTRESYTLGQGWAKPRVEKVNESPFYSETFFGSVPNPAYLRTVMPVSPEGAGGPALAQVPQAKDSYQGNSSLMLQFSKYMPLTSLLLDHGYRFVNQTLAVDDEGMEAPMLRFGKPGSDSSAGVLVFWSADRYRCYSHHTNDPLHTGYALDSFDAFCILNNLQNKSEAIQMALDTIHEGVAFEMNADSPTVLAGGNKFRIVNRIHSENNSESVAYMTAADFRMSLENTPAVPIATEGEDGRKGVKYVPRADFWLRCTRRIQFHGDTFVPVRLGEAYNPVVMRQGKPYYNLFRGWNITPVPGDWSLIDWHIRNVLCSGDQDQYDYLLDWVAHLVQFPNEKPDVAVVMRAGKGVGKSLFMSKLARSMGTAGMVFSGNNLLTGRFNNHMRNKLLLVLEESFWAGNKQDEGRLKHLISDEETTYEAKGIDAQQGTSVARISMITNNDWSAPVSSDERRYFLPTISEAGKERDKTEGQYFSRLSKSLDGGGLAAFLHDMLSRPTSKDALRNVPNTAEFRRQQELSLDGLNAWVFDALKLGAFMSDRVAIPIPEMKSIITGSDLMDSAKKYLGPFNAQRSSLVKINHHLQEVFGPAAKAVAVSGLTTYSFELYALSELRTRYEQKAGYKIDW